jgi:hypothetical protein
MTKQTIKQDLESKKRENIFDDYYLVIEKNKNFRAPSNRYDSQIRDSLNVVRRALTVLERNLDDLHQSKKVSEEASQLAEENVTSILETWLPVYQALAGEHIFSQAFAYNTLALANFIANEIITNSEEWRNYKNFFTIAKRDLRDFNKYSTLTELTQNVGLESIGLLDLVDFNEMEFLSEEEQIKILHRLRRLTSRRVNNYFHNQTNTYYHTSTDLDKLLIIARRIFKNLSVSLFSEINFKKFKTLSDYDTEVFRSTLSNSSVKPLIDNLLLHHEGDTYEWNIEFKFEDGNRPDQIGLILIVLAKLELIDDVEVELSDWGRGSFWAKIKLKTSTFLAKEEVKEVLDKARKATESQLLDRPIEDVRKIKAEADKTESEAGSIMSKEQSKEFNNLLIEQKRAEIAKLKVETKLAKIKGLKDLSKLIQDGLLGIDSDYQILINELLFIGQKDSKLMEGESMNLIDSEGIKESTKEKEDGDEVDLKQP